MLAQFLIVLVFFQVLCHLAMEFYAFNNVELIMQVDLMLVKCDVLIIVWPNIASFRT
jgi:hypothetical protein